MAKNSKQTIESDLIRELARLLDETGLSEIEYGTDGLSIRVVKHAIPSNMSVAPAPVTGLIWSWVPPEPDERLSWPMCRLTSGASRFMAILSWRMTMVHVRFGTLA